MFVFVFVFVFVSVWLNVRSNLNVMEQMNESFILENNDNKNDE